MATADPCTRRVPIATALILVSALTAPHLAAEEAPAKLIEKQVRSLGTMAPDAPTRLFLSPGGHHLAYVLGKWGVKYRVMFDGNEGPPYDTISEPVWFSPDGKRLAYLARRGHTNWFVLDGEEKPCYPRPWFAFSPDSRHVAYIGSHPVRGYCAMWDDKMELFYIDGLPVFSPDSRHLAYTAAGKKFVVYDGKKERDFDEVASPVFSPDSQLLAYAARDKNVWGVVCGKARQGPYSEVGRLVFSPDSTRLSYRARRDKSWFIVCGTEKGPPFTDTGDPVFSLDGRRRAYRAADSKNWFILCDGKKSPDYHEVGDPVFSPDGKHVAYRAVRDGRCFVVCDGREGTDCGEISWVGFSPDSEHLALAASRPKEKLIVCDGLEGPAHDKLLVPEQPTDVRGKLRYVVIDGVEASLVEVDWPENRTWEDAFKRAD